MQLIYITCVSGVVYDIIHDVPFVGVDNKGQAVIFSGGVSISNKQESGAVWCRRTGSIVDHQRSGRAPHHDSSNLQENVEGRSSGNKCDFPGLCRDARQANRVVLQRKGMVQSDVVATWGLSEGALHGRPRK